MSRKYMDELGEITSPTTEALLVIRQGTTDYYVKASNLKSALNIQGEDVSIDPPANIVSATDVESLADVVSTLQSGQSLNKNVVVTFADVDAMKAGILLDGSVVNTIDLATIQAIVKVREPFSTTVSSGDEFVFKTASQHRTDIGDNAWVPDNQTSFYLLGGTTYVAVRLVNSSSIDGKVSYTDIVDNLLSTDPALPLSANQGRVLKVFVDSINTLLASDDTTLDQLQEVVTYIKQNKAALDSLGIANIAGLQDALNAKQALITGTASSITTTNLTANRVLVTDSISKAAASTVTTTELGYLTGATSNIQTQINNLSNGTGVSDHGALSGLTDDDHLQYHNDARGDARYSLKSNNLSDLSDKAVAFSNIKQAATMSTSGVVQLASGTESADGTDNTKAITPSSLGSRLNNHGLRNTSTWSANTHISDFTVAPAKTGFYTVANSATGLPSTITDGTVIVTATTSGDINYFVISAGKVLYAQLINGVLGTWEEFNFASDLETTSSHFDYTVNRVTTVGNYGLGTASYSGIDDYDLFGIESIAKNRFFATGLGATSSPARSPYHSGIAFSHYGTVGSESIILTSQGDHPLAVRNKVGGTWQGWRYVWDSVNFDPTTKSDTNHTHTSATISDLIETIQDVLWTTLNAGTHTNVAVTYDDTAGSISLSSTSTTGDGTGVTDHGALTGLGDDDHPHYHNDARGDARYPLKTNNLSDLASAATAFNNIKQLATTTTTGVVELATTSEAITGASTNLVVAPAGVHAAFNKYGIGKAVSIIVPDVNTLTTPGWYYVVSNATNLPIASAGLIWVGSGDFSGTIATTQIYYPHSTSTSISGRSYTRWGNGTWGPWVRNWNSSDFDPANKVDVSALAESVQDIMGTAFAGGTHSGITISYNDTSGTFSLSATGVADHGNLTGLSDDDHPQYFNQARGDSRYSQMGHTHTISHVTGLQTALDGKASSGHTHTIAQVTNLQAELDGKASSSHGHVSIDGADITDLDATGLGDNNRGLLKYNAYSSSATNKPFSNNNANGVLTMISHTGPYGKQVAFGDSDDLYMRAMRNGAFLAWRKFWHDGNFNPSSYSLTSHNHTGVYANASHTHATSDVSGLLEYIQDSVAGMLSGAHTNITVAYNDTAGTITLSGQSGSGTAVTDHGALTGLGDDDHPHYFNQARGDARYALVSHAHTIANVSGLQSALDGKASSSVNIVAGSGLVTGGALTGNVTVNMGTPGTLTTTTTNSVSADSHTHSVTFPVTSVAGKTGAVSLAKADVGLSQVDNTSDANKPISTATQNALNEKASYIVPQNILSSSRSLSLSDIGDHLYHPGTTPHSLTIPTNATVAFPIGASTTLVVDGSASVTVAPASGVVMVVAGVGPSGNKAFAQYSMVTLLKVGTDRWYVSGAGSA